MYDKKEIIKRIPTSWENFKLKDYLKCVDIKISEGHENEINELFSGLDNTLSVISKLSNVPVETLETMDFAFIQQLGTMLSFIKELPKSVKSSSIKWKKVDEVTYNDFVSFITLSKDAVHSMGDIIKTFSKTELSIDEINEMSVAEVYGGFFMLRNYLNKYFLRLIQKEAMNLTRKSIKTLFNKKFRNKKKN